jgi:hypothetical protein
MLSMSIYVNYFVNADTYFVKNHINIVNCYCGIALLYTYCVKCRNFIRDLTMTDLQGKDTRRWTAVVPRKEQQILKAMTNGK